MKVTYSNKIDGVMIETNFDIPLISKNLLVYRLAVMLVEGAIPGSVREIFTKTELIITFEHPLEERELE